ncbi:hypothetical protein JCM33774_55870 [Actinophytocola sp. KF-1]
MPKYRPCAAAAAPSVVAALAEVDMTTTPAQATRPAAASTRTFLAVCLIMTARFLAVRGCGFRATLSNESIAIGYS